MSAPAQRHEAPRVLSEQHRQRAREAGEALHERHEYGAAEQARLSQIVAVAWQAPVTSTEEAA